MNAKFSLVLAGILWVFSSSSFGQIVGSDDFDGNDMFLVRSITPDNSGNGGTFPTSPFDVFGIVDRTVNNDFSDDTLIDPMFTGLIASSITDNFFGSEDLTNNDHPDGTGTIVYEFNISGAQNLVFSVDFAARGDFEIANDSLEISASIDGGASQLLMELLANEEVDQTYTYEDGVTMETIVDPMTINGTLLDNNFQNFSANINGTGNILVLTLSFAGDGGSETIAMDNILIEGKDGKGCTNPLGDVNGDGVVSLLDVNPFVTLLTSGGFQCEADVNEDGVVSLLDVNPFVVILTGG